jgi:hypothetical protein
MKKYTNILGAVISTFTIVLQFILMFNKSGDFSATIVKYFSYFTLLSNFIIALFFNIQVFFQKTKINNFFNHPSTITAITIYIIIVAIVYNIILRKNWSPTGFDRLADELLHLVIPIYFVLYWFLYTDKSKIFWIHIIHWQIFPIFYLLYTFIRGKIVGFYPYLFVNVNKIGIEQVVINSIFLVIFFIFVSTFIVFISKILAGRAKKLTLKRKSFN